MCYPSIILFLYYSWRASENTVACRLLREMGPQEQEADEGDEQEVEEAYSSRCDNPPAA